MKVIGYSRCSTREQGDSGLGLEAQRSAIADECGRRGWQLVEILEDVASGSSMSKRVALCEALERLSKGEADALVVSKVDRLSRSLLDFSALVEKSGRQGWRLVILDLGVDTSTASGELLVNVLMTFAVFERRMISQRTKDALAVARERGTKLGRPETIPAEIRARIKTFREAGLSLRAICNQLTEEGVQPPRGAAWRPSSLEAVLKEAASA